MKRPTPASLVRDISAVCLYAEQHQKMEVGSGCFLHVKTRETKHPPQHYHPRGSCQPNLSSAQSPHLMVKINCEARWIFTRLGAQISATSLWAACPHCVPSPHPCVSPRCPLSQGRPAADQMHTSIQALLMAFQVQHDYFPLMACFSLFLPH